MMLVAKLLALFTQPLTWVIGLLLVAWLLLKRQPRLGRRLVGVALLALLAIGWQPLPDSLVRQLESHYPEFAPQADLSGYVGAVVLGGALDAGYVALGHAQPLTGEGGERMTAPVAMLLRNPGLRIVFTGGEGELLGSGFTEAARAKNFFDSMGVAPERVRYESASRNTHENAVLTAQLPGLDKTQRWLLVTSAWHMPRSMATFQKAGWNVTAYPVDFRTAQATPWTEYSMQTGVARWQLALHEYLGMLSYRLTGRM